MTDRDGGPAFPSGGYTEGHREDGTPVIEAKHSGMSLRDWFAGQALAGQLASGHQEVHDNTAKAAMWSYEYADAMLRARKETNHAND